MIRKVREWEPRANIVPIDYDPSATKVNQENRIKLMLAVARENLAQGDGGAPDTRPNGASAPEQKQGDVFDQLDRFLPQQLSLQNATLH